MDTDKKIGRIMSRSFRVFGAVLLAMGVAGAATACDTSAVRNQQPSYRQ